MNKRNYGLITAITMITGIVIGSGIFFKSDDVLTYTNGNVLLGVFVFLVAAIAIIFGCLAISQLATRTDKPGGLVAYAEEFVGIGVSTSFGWFQTFLYLPSIAAVVAWVTGIYVTQLLGIEGNLENWTLIGIITLTVLFIMNILSAKLGGYFQNASMLIKLIPLLLIAIAGLIFGESGTVISNDVKTMGEAASSFGWVAAFAPIAFSFDGWIVSTSICNEIKNSKRNLPIALTISPLIILVAYVAYYVGMSTMVGPETILEQKDASAFTAATMLFGNIGAKIILAFVVVSILGTVNGLVLGYIRMPYSLALRNMIPGSKILAKEEKKLAGMPLNSAIFAYVITLIWMFVHYISQKIGMRGDVSEIAIGVSYLNYIVLYIAVIRLAKIGEITNKIKGYFVPILAIAGSLVIISGSISHPLFIYYFVTCAAIMGFGFLYYQMNKNNIL
ncbi:MAG: amino acid permease-associated region [Herbinix sp.]|jgi:APA family basic amino acid/polyamine antiporter|nr:amino acid permease-associated region [Herbinix sp.]